MHTRPLREGAQKASPPVAGNPILELLPTIDLPGLPHIATGRPTSHWRCSWGSAESRSSATQTACFRTQELIPPGDIQGPAVRQEMDSSTSAAPFLAEPATVPAHRFRRASETRGG